MSADLVGAFDALRTRDSSKQALELVFSQLSPYEWRMAQDMLAARTFQFDIIGALPVELVALVFSHIDTDTAFYLQRVSKRWYTLLRSPAVLQPALESWHDIHRFVRGKPLHHTDLVAETTEIAYALGYVEPVLVEQFLAGVDKSKRALVVNNLQTQTSWHMYGAAREEILKVVASDEIVAFTTTSNTCYVADLTGSKKHDFKLFGAMFHALACHGRTVVCGGVMDQHVELFIWDFDSQHGKLLRLSRDQAPFSFWAKDRPSPISLILNSHSKSVIVITSVHRCSLDCAGCPSCEGRSFKGNPPSYPIGFGCFTLDGSLLWAGDSRQVIALNSRVEFKSIRPVDRRGGYALRINSNDPDEATMDNLDSLRFNVPGRQFVANSFSIFQQNPGIVPKETDLWNDVVYAYMYEPGDEIQFRPLDPKNEYRGDSEATMPDQGGHGFGALVNDRFAVRWTMGFDEDGMDVNAVRVYSFCT